MLSDNDKRLVTLGDNVDEWCRVLLKKFRELPTTAQAILNKERYTMADAARQREPIEYIQAITRAGKSTDFPTYNQMLIIWNGLDPEFQRDVEIPSPASDLGTMVEKMERMKEIWWNLAKARQSFPGYTRETAWLYQRIRIPPPIQSV